MNTTIPLSDMEIQSIKADLVKGHVDITLRGRLSLEFMKLRTQLMELAMDGKPLKVLITPPPSLFDEITLSSGNSKVTLGGSSDETSSDLEVPA